MPYQLSEELVDKLLDKLSSDNEFRSVFQKSPRIALAYLGHEEASKAGDGDWSHLICKTLASAETIQGSRDAIRKDLLTSHSALIPIMLDIADARLKAFREAWHDGEQLPQVARRIKSFD